MKSFSTDGRLIALAMLCLYALLLWLSIGVAGGDRLTVMREWFGVPAIEPLFADLRHVTEGWDAVEAGLSPEEANPFDDFRRPFTYPKLWLLPGKLGLDSRATSILAGVTFAAFLLVAMLSLGRLTMQEGILAGLVLSGPPIILALERCNIDLWAFCLVGAGVLLGRPQRRLGLTMRFFLLLVAAMGKLHPVGAVLCLLQRSLRKTLIGVGSFLVVFSVYFALTFSDNRRIAELNPQVDWFSYGGRIGFDFLLHKMQRMSGLEIPHWLAIVAYKP